MVRLVSGRSKGGRGDACPHRQVWMAFVVMRNDERHFLHVSHFLLRPGRKNSICCSPNRVAQLSVCHGRWNLYDALHRRAMGSAAKAAPRDRDGAREESAEVMTRSRMWFLLRVGKFTCWIRLKDDRTERNWDAAWSDGLLKCILKSPMITNSWGEVAATERKELNSPRKREKV